MLGVRTLLALPPHIVDIALGVSFISMVPTRRWLARSRVRFTLVHLMLIGAPVGFLTGIVVSTGPITGTSIMLGTLMARRIVAGCRRAPSGLSSMG